ncbi:MAG: GvpL/GvpF family gas vesicle protein [Candidatus Omnitrophota bacterium]
MSILEKEGKYIYCVIGTKQERNFGPIGIGGRNDEVLTVGHDDLSMVVSNHPMGRFVVNRENMLAHQKVIEEVMKEFDSVLPVRFGTLASNADEIRNLLDRRGREFKNALKDMDHKVEVGVKAIWKNMYAIFKEIARENKMIKDAKENIQNHKGKKDIQDGVELGRMVEQALGKKKEESAEEIINILKRLAVDYRLNNNMSEEMFMNASFLISKAREKEFDNIMDDLSERRKEKVKFLYAGPLPVFNFVNLAIYPEEWEK